MLAGLITRSEESRGEIERKLDVQGWKGMGENSTMQIDEKGDAECVILACSI